MNANVRKIGMRKFRENLPQFLLDSSPVAITRHGQTVGYYIPAHKDEPDKAEVEALMQAAIRLEKMLAAYGVTEEELLSEFKTARANKKK